MLNSFNPEIQLKDTKYAIKSKLIDLLSELRGFKFRTTLILEFKKTENDDETKYSTFYLKQLLMKVILTIYLNQFILRSCQTYKHFLDKVLVGLLLQP